ncbi:MULTISPECIES: DUF986 family protein [Mannheimia]|uniref:UPF0266 membrane protein YobD n=1 Tax=Mannheimia pernigra TaxID=111844 RepID=A0A7D5DW71_9PAST|nr:MULTISPECIES: DUF986 family protein [Mannheimia]QLB40047.1 DUF986 domain-containing protein [Mannheimia pernigra]QTM00774.1 DUF986 family protein [Mannheimia sp. ZY171111]
MTNTILFLFILLSLLFAVYDQILMDRLKGRTKLTIILKKQKTIDTWLLIGLIILSIGYGVQNQISAFTLYLLSTCVILAVYLAFFRSPRLLLKQEGFFFANIYFNYAKIYQINIAEINTNEKVLVIDLHGGRRLLAQPENEEDLQSVVNFFEK